MSRMFADARLRKQRDPGNPPARMCLPGMHALLLFALVLCTLRTAAHVGGTTGYASLQVQDNALRYELTLSSLPQPLLDAHGGDATRALDAARDAVRDGLVIANAGTPCVPAAATTTPPSAARVSVAITIDYVCAAAVSSLVLRDDSFERLGTDLHVLGRATRGTDTRTFTLATESRAATLIFDSAPATTTATNDRGFVAFVKLGVEHILIGYDHLLFLLALLLAGGNVSAIVRIVTAFTLAHSLTLALTALDVLRFPSVLVEATIAASIAWVAAENLWARNPLSRRVWVTAAFGLVHGCGFASVLRDIGLPTDSLWSPLLGFNLGVELGQLTVIAILVPLLRWLARGAQARLIMVSLSSIVCAVGVWLVVSRVLAG